MKSKNTTKKFYSKDKSEKYLALNGGEAIAHALRQINPDVFAMYPITPQTPIIETFAKFEAQGSVDTQIIRVESEHSALSAVIGASASGSRAVTATASQGLLYMYEMLSVASGLRLPIVMPIANRAISAPINIHCDHSDTMSALDQGWIQLYCENAQESYELTIFAMKLSEKVKLPSMVCIDGFFTSHTVVNVKLFEDNKVKKFIGEYKPSYNLLDTNNPITLGALSLPDSYFEIRVEMFNAFNNLKIDFEEVSKDFKNNFGKEIKICEDYFASNSEIVIIVMYSTAESTKDVIDKFRAKGKSVGLLRPILFRPFIYEEYFKYLKQAKQIIVLDRSESIGSQAPLYKDVCLTIFNNSIDKSKEKPKVYSYVFGLGGREFSDRQIEELLLNHLSGKIPKEKYLGLKK
ncbi:MAG: pyruvate ferredoxin oxidoreductase [archaeon]